LSGYWRSTGSRGEGEQGSRGCLSSGYPFSLIHQRIFFGKFKLIRAKLNKTSQKLHGKLLTRRCQGRLIKLINIIGGFTP